jgi:hypothetical protein
MALLRDAAGLVTLLCHGTRRVEWHFTADEDEVRASLLPPLPCGAHLDIRTLPADGDSNVGGRVWHSAPVMCRWLASIAAEIDGAAVVELGCGTGACGIYCTALGASRVVLTDGGAEPLLRLAAQNLRVARESDARVARCIAEVRPLAWGCSDRSLPEGYFDWIIGSDIIYDPSAHAALCRTLRALLLRMPAPDVLRGPSAQIRPRAVLCTMPRGCVKVDGQASESYVEAALVRFTSAAAQHALCVTAVKGDAVRPPAVVGTPFRWTATSFRTAGPFLLEVSLTVTD